LISLAVLSAIVAVPAPSPAIHELVTSTGSSYHFAVVMSIPPEMDDVRGALQEAVRLLPDGTALHRRRSIADLTSGRGVQAWTTTDQVVIRATLDSNSLTDAVTLAYGLIYRPQLEPRDAAEFSPGWYTPLWQRLTRRAPTANETRDAWHYLVRNGKIHVVFSGPFATGQAQAIWSGLTDSEPPNTARVDRPRPDGFPRFPAVNAAWLDAPPTANPSIAAVTAMLLGQGKSSVLFRVARQELGLSYRQEAFLWPTAGGWQPRVYLTSADPLPIAKLEQLKERMLAEVSIWNESDLQHAKQMLVASISGEGVWSPWMIGPSGGAFNTPEDRTILEAFCRAYDSKFDANAMVALVNAADLDAVQSAAKAWLAHDWQVITANPR